MKVYAFPFLVQCFWSNDGKKMKLFPLLAIIGPETFVKNDALLPCHRVQYKNYLQNPLF